MDDLLEDDCLTKWDPQTDIIRVLLADRIRYLNEQIVSFIIYLSATRINFNIVKLLID